MTDMENPKVISYDITEFSNYKEGDVFPVYDALMNITFQLAKMDLDYMVHFTLAGSHMGQNGHRFVEIEFKTEETAMMVKLKGLVKN